MTNRKKIRCEDKWHSPMTETKATKKKMNNNSRMISNSNRRRRGLQGERSNISNNSVEMMRMTNNKFKVTLRNPNIVLESCRITKMISKTITNELSNYHRVFFHKFIIRLLFPSLNFQ